MSRRTNTETYWFWQFFSHSRHHHCCLQSQHAPFLPFLFPIQGKPGCVSFFFFSVSFDDSSQLGNNGFENGRWAFLLCLSFQDWILCNVFVDFFQQIFIKVASVVCSNEISDEMLHWKFDTHVWIVHIRVQHHNRIRQNVGRILKKEKEIGERVFPVFFFCKFAVDEANCTSTLEERARIGFVPRSGHACKESVVLSGRFEGNEIQDMTKCNEEWLIWEIECINKGSDDCSVWICFLAVENADEQKSETFEAKERRRT